jgi:hypothetical protein
MFYVSQGKKYFLSFRDRLWGPTPPMGTGSCICESKEAMGVTLTTLLHLVPSLRIVQYSGTLFNYIIKYKGNYTVCLINTLNEPITVADRSRA